MQDLIAKAATLLEALPYIQRFRGQTFVIKYGGSFMDFPDDAVRSGVARDIVFLEAVGINAVIVHGGGKAISRALQAAGLKSNFVQGHRVTDEEAVKLVDEVPRDSLQLSLREQVWLTNDAALSTAKRNVHDRALPRHPSR